MKENRVVVVINKPISEVFEFTTNPKNTHLWIPSIKEEISEEYPPKINTIYKNRGKGTDWDYYKVLEFKKDKIFTLTDREGNYSVKYTYKSLGNNKTEMEYFEWMRVGELSKPFTQAILTKLKEVMEHSK